jgi:2-keto-4-pentenoate hydratase/2-oxohepta-3-ene-1,7-dioic acid hydratase in catechol pathway
MKLVTFRTEKSAVNQFGLVLNEKIYSFNSLMKHFKHRHTCLESIDAYLEDLPASYHLALELQDKILTGKNHVSSLRGLDPDRVMILPPVPKPAALLDFGLSPRHLINSACTLFRHELPWPVNYIAWSVVRRRLKKIDTNRLLYYKGNHNELIGHGETTHWPSYTSYLDIEPELAFVTGKSNVRGQSPENVVAGYCILNDFSARDVQFPEMIGLGLARSKDFARGNGLGPVLVTPDEAGYPLSLAVTVSVGERYVWKGTTAEYAAAPGDIIRFLEGVFTLRAGTVIGMGTVPGCCGLDNDRWLWPGDRIDITFDKLGTLTQYIPADIGVLQNSRWTHRQELECFYSQTQKRH